MEILNYPQIGETLYKEILPNGLTILYLEKKGYQKAHAVFAANYGGADRDFLLNEQLIKTPAGIAHYLEHKMFDMPDGSNALMTLSSRGASVNAFTASDMTAYYFTSTTSFYENLELLLRFVSTPYYTEETVEKERGIIGQEIRMGNDNPGRALYYGLYRALFENHPIRDEIAGTIESIAEITAQTLYDCHKVFYSPSNMVLCCIGDLKAEKIREIASDILPKECESIPSKHYGVTEELECITNRVETNMAVSAPLFMLGSKLSIGDSKETLARTEIVGNLVLRYLVGPSSPFYNTLYKEGLLNSDFSAGINIAADTAVMLINGECRDVDSMVNTLKSKVDSAVKNGFDEERFERCRRSYYGEMLQGLTYFEDIGRSLAGAFFMGANALDSFSILNSITAEECRSLAKKMFDEARLAISIVQPL